MSEKKLKIVRGAGVNTKSFTECPYGTGNKVYSYNCQQCKDYVRRVGSGTDFSVECNYGEENRQQLKLSLLGLDEDERKRVLEYAECLRKSRIKHMCTCCDDDASLFGGLNSTEGGQFVVVHHTRGLKYLQEITIPLETLKVCPWMCAKYGVGIIASYKEMQGGGPMNDKYSFKSHIDKACFLNWWGSNGFDVLDIKFSLIIDNLPKGITLC